MTHHTQAQALAADLHAAIAELTNGARYPDLTEAIDKLAALAQPQAEPDPIGYASAARLAEIAAGHANWLLVRAESDFARGETITPVYASPVAQPPVQAVPEGWRPVPKAALVDLLNLIDPPPIELAGKVHVFVNPNAAEILRRISAIVRAMLAAAPTP